MQKPLPLNQQQLSRAWDVSQRSTAADWNEWLRRLNVDLLKESPSPALRSCSALAQAYTPLARDLFHAAFVSCWHELSEQYQDSLVSSLHEKFNMRSNCICFYFTCTSLSSLLLSSGYYFVWILATLHIFDFILQLFIYIIDLIFDLAIFEVT